jgi:uncharacterized protein YabN with tetrapyrrole methylase and pyrophosphatase domain
MNIDEKNLLKVVENQEIAAKNIGFYWENLEQIVDQIKSECAEVIEAWKKGDREHLQEEVGDLLQASISLAVYCGLDSEETLQKSTQKFQKRFDLVVSLAKQDGFTDLHVLPFSVLLAYWNRAKFL